MNFELLLCNKRFALVRSFVTCKDSELLVPLINSFIMNQVINDVYNCHSIFLIVCDYYSTDNQIGLTTTNQTEEKKKRHAQTSQAQIQSR